MNSSVDRAETGFAELSDKGKIAYRITGREHDSIPVLLIRPLGGSIALWGSFGDLLAERFRVIAFDHRGAGHSSDAPAWVTTRGLARDALAVLDRVGAEKAHVFGISLGGMTATWLAILAPRRISRLCIAAAPARGIELSHAGIRRDLALAACFARPREEVEFRLVDRILSRHFRDSHPDEVRRIEDVVRARASSRVGLLKHALAGALHDVRSELHRIDAPTLVLAGDRDHLVGVEPVRHLASHIAKATFEIVADSGHDLTLEQPIATAARVSSFFAET